MRAIFSLAVLGMGAVVFAAEPGAAPVSGAGTEVALRDLSSEDFATREKGLRELQMEMGRQVQMLLGPDDAETRGRVAALLEFDEGLSRWVLGVMALPTEERRAELAFGLQPEVLPLVAKIGAKSAEQRLEGVRGLARRKEAIVGDVLAPLLEDTDRGVYVAVMEAAWDREPTGAMVDRLWDRAVEAGFAVYNPGGQAQGPEVFFRGQALGPTFYDNAAYRRMQDADIACEVLVHMNSPAVNGKLASFFERVVKAMEEANPQQSRTWMYGATSAPMKNVYKLVNAYRPREVFGALFALATGQMRQPVFNGQVNKAHFFWSNRTMPMAMLVLLTDQDPGEYKLAQVTRPAGTWAFGSQLEEDGAIGRLRQWWAGHPEFSAGGAGAGTMPAGK